MEKRPMPKSSTQGAPLRRTGFRPHPYPSRFSSAPFGTLRLVHRQAGVPATGARHPRLDQGVLSYHSHSTGR